MMKVSELKQDKRIVLGWQAKILTEQNKIFKMGQQETKVG